MSDYLVVAAVVVLGLLLVVAAAGARRLLAPVALGAGWRSSDEERARLLTDPRLSTYESGVDPVGAGWEQGSVRYLVFTLLYVIFAVDAVYLFPWALVVRTDLGMASLAEMGIFIGVLVVALLHVWRRGLLRWW